MTTTSNDLQGILSAKKAELNGQPPPDVIEADVMTGEIVPAAAADAPPITADQGATPIAPGQAAAPAPEQVTVFPVVPPKVVGGIPYARDYVKLAKTIAMTEMVPQAFRGRYDAITAAFLRGYEMGLPPMQALDSFNVIQGKVGLTAEAMRALILNAGHDIVLSEVYASGAGDLVGVKAECHRKGWPDDRWATYIYDLDDAKKAGLLGKGSWQNNPRAMLDARATSGAGRRYFADVLAGMSYTPEEIRDFSGPEQEAPSSPTTANTSPPQSSGSTDSSPLSASTTPSTESSGQTPPAKKPRGRPRKNPAVQKDAPAAPTSPSESTLLAESTDPPVGEVQPETTSLNEPLSLAVTASMLSAYHELIRSLPQTEQPLCRAYMARYFSPRTLAELGEADIQTAINIVAGWPDSTDQYPLTEEQEELF